MRLAPPTLALLPFSPRALARNTSTGRCPPTAVASPPGPAWIAPSTGHRALSTEHRALSTASAVPQQRPLPSERVSTQPWPSAPTRLPSDGGHPLTYCLFLHQLPPARHVLHLCFQNEPQTGKQWPPTPAQSGAPQPRASDRDTHRRRRWLQSCTCHRQAWASTVASDDRRAPVRRATPFRFFFYRSPRRRGTPLSSPPARRLETKRNEKKVPPGDQLALALTRADKC